MPGDPPQTQPEFLWIAAQIRYRVQDDTARFERVEDSVVSGVQHQSSQWRIEYRCHFWKLPEQFNRSANQRNKPLT